MKVVIAPDKFKGALSALQVAESLRDGFASVWPDAQYHLLPIADGGDGTAEVLQQALAGSWETIEVHDPVGRPIKARICFATQREQSIAVFEMSEASGLRLLAEKDRNPLRANTRGTGELILSAAKRGVSRIILGLGGSATNDGGIGMAAALGFRFYDPQGAELEPMPENLLKLHHIEPPSQLALPAIIAAVDVQNPLLGPKGATRTYGPQKGANEETLQKLEAGLERLADVAETQFAGSWRNHPGTGAAGGLGFGLLAFCHAEIQPGFGIIADALNLQSVVADCDIIVTGEGSMDAQTLHGKAPAGLAQIARNAGKPIIAFAGSINDEEQLRQLFHATCPLTPRPMSLEESIRHTSSLLKAAAARAAQLIQLGFYRR